MHYTQNQPNQYGKVKKQKYEDSRGMKLTHYVMAERCLQVEIHTIVEDYKVGNYDTLTHIVEGGFKGFHNMEQNELIKEYKAIENKWYELEANNELHWEPLEDDPIHTLKEEI